LDFVLSQTLKTKVPPTQHQASFYANNVVQYIHPTCADLCVIMEILEIFGHASGLKTYLQKSSITPIGCFDAEPAVIYEVMLSDRG
jgi:hypothetical protein